MRFRSSFGFRVFSVFRTVSAVAIVGLLGGMLFYSNVYAAAPAYVQSASITNNGNGTTIAKAFTSPNTAGNLLVAAVTWDSNNAGTFTCTDSQANTYVNAVSQWDSLNTQWLGICYAPNSKAGANTVTVTFNGNRPFRRLVVSEYSGISAVSPVDVTAKNVATATTATDNVTSGSATTTVAGDLIFGAVMDDSTATAITAGTGFTQRASLNNKDFATQDKIQAAAGSVASTQTFGAAHRYIAGMVAFKSATQAPADTTPPTIPTGLTGSAVSTSQINLSWTASTDDTGVVGYKVFRDNVQIGTTATTSFQDTGLAAGATYAYSVSAYDAAGNNSARITSINVTTQADTTPPAMPTGLSAQATSSTQVNLSWTASSDNVGVAGYKIYRDGAQVGTSSGTTFQDTSLTASTTYAYSVSAYDAAGNESARTNPVSVTTPAPQAPPDTVAPGVSMSAPLPGTTVSGTVTVSATATDNVGVAGVQFMLDGAPLGAEDTTAPYSVQWDTTAASNSTHILTARARDSAGNTQTTSGGFTVVVANTVVVPQDMVAGWTFNEGTGTTVTDVSGNGNNALVTTSTWASGKYGGGMQFGNGKSLDVPSSPSLDISGNALTLEMWANPANTAGDQVLLGKFWNPTMSSPYYQYGIEMQSGTPVFEVGTTGNTLRASMGSTLPAGQWSHLAVTFDGSTVRFYLNGNLVSSPSLAGSLTARGNYFRMGADATPAQYFNGSLDDVRIYKRTLTQSQVQSDLANPLNLPSSSSGLTVNLDSPVDGAQVSGVTSLTADADIQNPNATITKVQFLVNGAVVGEDTTAPYSLNWDTRTLDNNAYALTARVLDNLGNSQVSNIVNVTVVNSSGFLRETLAGGLDIPVTIEFLPDGRMLVGELKGKIKVLSSPYINPSPTLFNDLSSAVGTTGFEQGIYDITLDPNFTTNHFYYVFYTAGGSSPHDRLSRFTANAAITGTVAGSEVVLYQDPGIASSDHHGGAVAFANDGKILFTTGEQFTSPASQDLTNPRGKVHRINPDGTAPTDNPFYDGAGPNWDSVYSLGLRNPYRAYYDSPTNRFIIGDVGGNVDSSNEEVNVASPGANFGWPNAEGAWCPSSLPAGEVCKNPLYDYEHNGQSASITGGFVYHGNQFPAAFQGSYFFGDYTQHWIKRATFDANGNVQSVTDFEPTPGAGDIVFLTEGPDGALYYIDLGYSGIDPQPTGPSTIKRIKYVTSNQSPSAIAAATPISGSAPLTVNFSSAGSMDPEGTALTYSWDFGDGTTSTAANPTHVYAQSGQYVARLTISDGENSSFSTPIVIAVGTPPTAAINAPTDGLTFRAGDVITFSGDATDPEDGVLPASAYNWTIDFLHESHVHPGYSVSGVKSGTFTIPSSGHDFSGNTRYRITLTVTDSNGLTNSKSVIVWPQKVNITFDAVPAGLTLYLDGIAHPAPFVYDTLIGFNHTLEARDQTVNSTNYTFASWSDGGAQTHVLTVPATDQTYTATYTAAQAPSGLVGAWGFGEGTGTTTADASGNSNTATLVNGPTWTAGQTGHGNALSFDGTNDNLTMPNSTSLNVAGNNLTLSMWVKPVGGVSDQSVIGKFWNTTMTSPYYQYGLEFQNGGLTPSFQVGTTSGVKEASMGSALVANQWSHLAIVFDGTQAQFYVNGTLVATKPLAATITARGNMMRVGADASPSQYYKGMLDDLRIYSRSLTAADVVADKNTAL